MIDGDDTDPTEDSRTRETVEAHDSHGSQRRPTITGYRIVRRLGEGGMGVVFEAEQQQPRRPVALKVVRGGPYLDDTRVPDQRFGHRLSTPGSGRDTQEQRPHAAKQQPGLERTEDGTTDRPVVLDPLPQPIATGGHERAGQHIGRKVLVQLDS